jgi:crotonobetainyl-CoA:carnitine CoA-transferase CaiB-like acyl-CoA transferase
MAKILENITILDLTRFFSGPQATLLLSGMGANVIKIDDPKTGDPSAFSPPYAGPHGVSFHKQTDTDMGLAYLKRARGKKSINLDLKSPEGHAIFLQLVKHADVVVDNFSVGVASRLKVDYASLCAANPSIIYCSLTGYGSTGPDKNLKAYDLMIQAAVGLMSVTGEIDSPPVKTGSSISDAISGAYAAMGILGALFHKQCTGQGQEIDVAMADCLFSMIYDEPFDCYPQLGIPQRQGNRIMRFSPCNTYQTQDGWLALGAATHNDWLELIDVLDKKEFLKDPNMMNVGWRIENNAMIDQIVSTWSKSETTQSGLEKLKAKGIPCAPVRTMQEAIQWEQLQQRKMVAELINPLSNSSMSASGPGFPIKFSKTPADYNTPSPIPGEHTEAILESLANLSKEELLALIKKGVIGNFESLKMSRPKTL